mmetsp:Transcript_12627/g.23420  ORF Transcript_12627/g.23420 Transcript_12627/m.23420 type:complete len:235 (+) Transcript_12627:380-1084(+)
MSSKEKVRDGAKTRSYNGPTISDMFGVRKSRRTGEGAQKKRTASFETAQPKSEEKASRTTASGVPVRVNELIADNRSPSGSLDPVKEHPKPQAPSECFDYTQDLENLAKFDVARGNLQRDIFTTVHYEPRGVDTNTLNTQFGKSPREVFNSNPNHCAAFQFVHDNYVIPENFDNSVRYGSRSGVCHEERVLSAFESGLLSLKADSRVHSDVKFCRECAAQGHFGYECPTKLQDI